MRFDKCTKKNTSDQVYKYSIQPKYKYTTIQVYNLYTSIQLNSWIQNSASYPNRLVLSITERIQSDEYIVLLICYTYKNIKGSHNRNIFKISEST